VRVFVVVIAMWVSAFRPTPQHLAEPSDHAAHLDLARPAFTAGLAAAPETAALPVSFAISLPHRSCAPVVTVATCDSASDTFASSQLARGPPV